VPPAAHLDTGDLFCGERTTPVADPGARLSMSDDLVNDEGHADGGDETEAGERSHVCRDG